MTRMATTSCSGEGIVSVTSPFSRRMLAPAIALLVPGLVCTGGDAPAGAPSSPPVPAPAGEAAGPQSPGAWLQPLLAAAHQFALAQPLVVIAKREEQRTVLSEAQVEARWSTVFNLGTEVDENHRLSNSFIDGLGVVRDRTTTATAALSQAFATGTSVKLQAGSSRADTTNPSAINDVFYTSSVQLIITQSLLQGSSREANLADLYTAREQLEANREATTLQLETLLESLGEDWVNLAQRDSEVHLRQARLEVSRSNLTTTEEMVKQGLTRQLNVLSVRRDLATQEAALAEAERARDSIRERLRVTWPGLTLPSGDGLAANATAVEPALASYADTLNGHTALRRISFAARTLGVARSNALDQLDLNVTLGKIGTDPTLDRSWSDISNRETYQWTVGLNYTHRFGNDQNRLELVRANVALDQARLQGDADERAWRSQDLTLRLTLKDAKARVDEDERVLAAYREEARLTKAQALAGLITWRDYLDLEQQVNDAEIAALQARLDVLRAELQLRLQEDRLLELVPK